ncbi:hypothetical protein K438DRAFT_1984795 [Mycena galopus ATCC 62051]|nr:hypothetical protein K438DRAFT_1984795 [Mycena galopus ATCC 62051]
MSEHRIQIAPDGPCLGPWNANAPEDAGGETQMCEDEDEDERPHIAHVPYMTKTAGSGEPKSQIDKMNSLRLASTYARARAGADPDGHVHLDLDVHAALQPAACMHTGRMGVRLHSSPIYQQNSDLRRLENDADERKDGISRDDQYYAFKPATTLSSVFAALLRRCWCFTLAGHTGRPRENGSGAIVYLNGTPRARGHQKEKSTLGAGRGGARTISIDDRERGGRHRRRSSGGPAILGQRVDGVGIMFRVGEEPWLIDIFFWSLASKGERKSNAQRRT